jgi:hypothetical protein
MNKTKQIEINEFEQYLFEGNPFISKLEENVLLEAQLNDKISEKIHSFAGFEDAPVQTKELALEKRFYLLPPHGYMIYTRILQLIRMGYLNRNPASDDYDKHLHEAGLDAPMPESLNDSGTAMLFRGSSGLGKTQLINRLLFTIPTVVEHEPSTETDYRAITQVVWIKIDMEVVGTRVGLITAIAKELDKRLNCQFAARIAKLKLLTDKRLAIIRYCRMVCLGLLVIDDSQWALKKYKTDDDRKVSNEFIEQLFNQLGVPMVFIATPEHGTLKATQGTTTRRISHNGNYSEEVFGETDEFWKQLVEAYFSKFLSVPESLLSPALFSCIYYYTGGNIGALKRLVADFLQKGLPKHRTLMQDIDVAYRNTKDEIEELKLPFESRTGSVGKILNTEITKKQSLSNVGEKTDKNKAIEDRAALAMQRYAGGGGANG